MLIGAPQSRADLEAEIAKKAAEQENRIRRAEALSRAADSIQRE